MHSIVTLTDPIQTTTLLLVGALIGAALGILGTAIIFGLLYGLPTFFKRPRAIKPAKKSRHLATQAIRVIG